MSRIDYDLASIDGVVFDMDGVLSASTVAVREDGTLQRHSNVKDGYAIQYAIRCGIRIAVISGARDLSMLPAYRSLGIEDVHFHVVHKKTMLEEWMAARGLTPDKVAYVGDDIPDIPAMRMVGLPCAPRDASVEAKAEARYISPCCGGQGVARDILSQILSARGDWMGEKAFEW